MQVWSLSRSSPGVLQLCTRMQPAGADDSPNGQQTRAARLRQLAHILDKGMQRKDYEIGRSLRYYEEATKILQGITDPELLSDPSVIWACRKLNDYQKMQHDPQGCSPHVLQGTHCSYDDFFDMATTRRSCRDFRSERVSDETIRQVLQVVNWAPSSCNRQTAHVFVTNDPDLARRSMRSCCGATCFSDFVPVFISFCADVRAYGGPHEAMMPYIDIALGVQNCNLAAHCLGLSLTLLTWAQRSKDDDRSLRHMLGIPDYCEIIVNGVLGYPQTGVETPARKSLEHTVHTIKTSG